MTVRLRVLNGKDIKKRLADLPLETTKGVRRAIEVSARELVRETKRTIANQPQVEMGRRSKYLASIPGQPPGRDTGELLRSVHYYLPLANSKGNLQRGLRAVVEVGAKFGKVLEFGLSSVAARPFFYPTWFRIRPKVAKRIRSAVRGAIRKKNAARIVEIGE